MKCLWSFCSRNTSDSHMENAERVLLHVTGYCGDHQPFQTDKIKKEGTKVRVDLKK